MIVPSSSTECTPETIINYSQLFSLYNIRKPRFFAGILTAVVSGSLAFTFLEPLFVPVGMNLSVVALYILTINAAGVGMCLGVLLPTVTPGACFGVALSLLVGTLITLVQPLYFPVTAAALSLVGAVLSAR